jgi:predicted anti-sigma-YlaC factor YlaD
MKIMSKISKKLGGCLEDEELLEYSLDGLDGKERGRAQEHLGHCQRCREQLREYMSFAEAMALSVPQVEPPTDLADKVLKKVTSH